MIRCMYRQRVQTASISLRVLSRYQRVKIAVDDNKSTVLGDEANCSTAFVWDEAN